MKSCSTCKVVLTALNTTPKNLRVGGYCNPCKNTRTKRWRKENSAKYKATFDAYMLRPEVKENRRRARAKFNRKCRVQVFDHYGWKCACCSETEDAFLTLDHIYGGGLAHVTSFSKGNLYLWVVKNKYPEDMFQTLCWNCNLAKYLKGRCPHPSYTALLDKTAEK